MKNGKPGDLVMNSTEAEKIIYRILAVYNDYECVIRAITPDKDGVIITNNSISLNKLIIVNYIYE